MEGRDLARYNTETAPRVFLRKTSCSLFTTLHKASGHAEDITAL